MVELSGLGGRRRPLSPNAEARRLRYDGFISDRTACSPADAAFKTAILDVSRGRPVLLEHAADEVGETAIAKMLAAGRCRG
jgi:hypothetical protein